VCVCVCVCLVLFDRGGRVRLSAPIPLVAAIALGKLKDLSIGASPGRDPHSPESAGHIRVHAVRHHPRAANPLQKTEEQRQNELLHATELGKANDVKSAGEMMIELCTLKTIAEHGRTNNTRSATVNCAPGFAKSW
jgi:hypothetical protein